MKHIKLLALSIAILWTVTGCCWTDHSKMIKEVAEPMAKHLEQFYKKEKRFPTIEERDKMLENIACTMNGEACTYKGKYINISSAKGYDYMVRFVIERTFCYIYLEQDGSIKSPSCHNAPCISLKQ